jgi:NADH-quinone oxidoreductase subunit H
MGKAMVMYGVFLWFRASLPRFRIDQLLTLAWKFLFPLSLLVIVAAAVWVFMSLLPALVINAVLLLGGYAALSWTLYREFMRSNVPKKVSRAR